jgi:hypothetical protein
VQCYRPPDEDWQNRRQDAFVGGAFNSLEALPGIGNMMSAIAGQGAAIASLTADDPREAERHRQRAKQNFFHAIPGIGNLSAARDATQDWGAYSDLGKGVATPPQTSEERWVSETGPTIDKLFDSIF